MRGEERSKIIESRSVSRAALPAGKLASRRQGGSIGRPVEEGGNANATRGDAAVADLWRSR